MTPDPVNGPSRRLRVLLVDDHRLFAEVMALRLALDPAFVQVEHASSLPAARARLNALRPDVVLLDFDLDGVCGLDLMPDVRALDLPPRVLVLSGDSSTEAIIAGLKAGAEGWVLKTSEVAVLVDAIRLAWQGQLALPKAHWGAVVRSLLPDPDMERRQERLEGLTSRQHDVLRCLVSGMTQREVAAQLFLSQNTIRTHVKGMFRQLGVRSTPALLACARQAGVSGMHATPPVRVPRQRTIQNV